ncbi:hypothetical protein PoB_006237000 [Plakobranchus ocellatus]|uniref:Uncharacterized protein n=1 Tax=Plakobranchus ocellatus TaxID=259542 RepID=A0AAV4CVG3_9GAST|nr:hypothetical protein PoB_006237000 [Plakobranchus ocellatus]
MSGPFALTPLDCSMEEPVVRFSSGNSIFHLVILDKTPVWSDSFAVELIKLDENTQQDQMRKLEEMRELHHRKASIFYQRKRAAKEAACTPGSTTAPVAFDFWRNMPIPNISKNERYCYSRSTSLISMIWVPTRSTYTLMTRLWQTKDLMMWSQ